MAKKKKRTQAEPSCQLVIRERLKALDDAADSAVESVADHIGISNAVSTVTTGLFMSAASMVWHVTELSEDDGDLQYWKAEAVRLGDEVRRLQKAHAILAYREWFAVGPDDASALRDPEGRFTLFFCDRSGTFPCCTLGPKDVLLVGRYTGEPEREAAVAALAGSTFRSYP